jgi:hypothetical protein
MENNIAGECWKTSPRPNKKVRVETIDTHPLLSLIQPMIPQSIPQPLTPIRPSTHLRQPLLPQLPILELELEIINDRIEYKAIEDKDGKRATELLGVIRATREDLSLLRKQLPPPLPRKSSFLSSCFHLLFILFYNQVNDQAFSPSTNAKKGLN